MATNDKLIEVTDLKKYYNKGAIKALDGVTATFNRGDVAVTEFYSSSLYGSIDTAADTSDHPLKGKLAGLRDCHVEPDLILLYRVVHDQLQLICVRIGTHADLFGL